jgi:mRNA interferase YafQ
MEIIRTTQFKRDFKKIRNNKSSVNAFIDAVNLLVAKKTLPAKYNEHPLTGNLQGFTDIHLKPDLLLLYYIDNKNNVLHLSRIGSHSELFG